MSTPKKARLRNSTRALLLEALAAAKLHAKTRNYGDYSRSVLAFVSGYCERQEPELAAAISDLLNSMFMGEDRSAA